VQARSDGPGRGSEFIVRLPVLEPGAARRPASAPNAAGGVQSARRILIVDDNADAASSLAMLLQVQGNEVHTAADGLAGLEAAERLRPDVVLLDLGMPRMNGYDACRAIRSQAWSAKAKLVALSGWGQEEHKARARDAGFDHFLVKPVAPEALRQLLADLK
jgi:CheY-like chemotaxis protein